MKIIEGQLIAEKILQNLVLKIKKEDIKPGLAVIAVGDDPASEIYIELKEKAAKKIGIKFHKYHFGLHDRFPLDLEGEIIAQIKNLNNDADIKGIIVQLPLPGELDTQKIINSIDPRKDVDGFHPYNVGLFFEDREYIWPVFPKAIVKMIEATRKSTEGKIAFVIANSEKFGEVMAKALNKKGVSAQYILTVDLENNLNKIKKADIVVVACGIPGLVKGSMLKKEAIVIDGGISKSGKKVFGDVEVESVKDMDISLSPVPGGVGPVTVATLMENVYLAGKKI